MRSINPATEKIIREYPDHTQKQIDAIFSQGTAARLSWSRRTMEERATLLRRLAEILRTRKLELATLMTLEMGKPITASESEIEKCAVTCEYFAKHAAEFLKPREIASDATRSLVRFDPLGLVLAIMPWNFPVWQALRAAIPALMAGNVFVLKHAPNVPGCALAIESLMREAGFPPGVFASLMIPDNSIAEQLPAHPAVSAVTLTGSERAGSAVAAAAGKALKKTVMELGGSDPFIVLADADVESVAKSAAESRCFNNGESCIAAKRFIVEAPVLNQFESAMTAAMKAIRVGDPMDRTTQLGPLARPDLVENLQRQVDKSLGQGAKLLLGGKRRAGIGFFFEPTVLTNVRPGMTAFDEETFGPVAAIIRAESADDAIALANQSRYGLGASIWTRDIDRAQNLAANLHAGAIFINGIVKSDARLPFGGIKNSGWGRELGEFGIHEFVNIKSVWIGPARP